MANRSKVSANKVASSAIEDAELAQIAQSEAWHIMLAMKSGLLTEASWAIDSLNTLLHDDSTATYFNLKNMPGLLDTLTDYFAHYLNPMFSLQISTQPVKKKRKISHQPEPIEEETTAIKLLDEEDHTWVTRKGKPVLVDPGTLQGPVPINSCTWRPIDDCEVKIPQDAVPAHLYQLECNVSQKMTSFLENSRHEVVKRSLFFGRQVGECSRTEEESRSHCTCFQKKWPFEDIKEPKEIAEQHVDQDTDTEEVLANGHCENHGKMNGDEKVKVNGVKEEVKVEEEVKKEVKVVCNGNHDEVEDVANTSLDSVEAPFTAMDADMFHDALPCCRTGLCSKSPRKKFKEEAMTNDSSPFRILDEGKFEQARRCLCISNVLRSFSFIPGNDLVMASNDTLIGILSRILLLEHRHEVRTENRPFERDDSDTIAPLESTEKNDQWWFLTLKLIRENALVVMANICNKLQLFHRSEAITLPLLDGLIHWAICPSSEAVDPLSNSILSLQRLALEALCKLCMAKENVDLVIATPPYSRLATFISTLVNFLSDKDQVLKEFAVVIFSYLVQGDPVVARTIGLYDQSVALLIDFVETAEQKASQIASEQGVHKFLENPEKMGTSLDMLRRAANTLVCIARVPESRQIMMRNEERLLALVMSQILDQQVAQTLSEVLYQCTNGPKELNDL